MAIRYDVRHTKCREKMDVLRAFIMLYVSYQLKYLQRNQVRSSGGRGNQQNFILGGSAPWSKFLPLELCISFNCRKCIVFKL